MKFFLRDAKGMRARMKTSNLRDTVHDIQMGLTCRINGLSPFTKTDMSRLRYTAQLCCQTDAELVRTYTDSFPDTMKAIIKAEQTVTGQAVSGTPTSSETHPCRKAN